MGNLIYLLGIIKKKMIGICIGVGLLILSFIINLTILKKEIIEYPTEVIEKIPWSGNLDDSGTSPIANYYSRVKYKIEDTEFYHTESTSSSSPQFNRKIRFKAPIKLNDKNKYIFCWSMKIISIIIIFISLIVKLIK